MDIIHWETIPNAHSVKCTPPRLTLVKWLALASGMLAWSGFQNGHRGRAFLRFYLSKWDCSAAADPKMIKKTWLTWIQSQHEDASAYSLLRGGLHFWHGLSHTNTGWLHDWQGRKHLTWTMSLPPCAILFLIMKTARSDSLEGMSPAPSGASSIMGTDISHQILVSCIPTMSLQEYSRSVQL